MFGWMKPKCPVDNEAKGWIESRLHWLSDNSVMKYLHAAPLFFQHAITFPIRWMGPMKAFEICWIRFARYMNVDPEHVDLELFTNQNELWLVNEEGKYLPTGAAGLYDEQPEKTVIHIETSELSNLTSLSEPWHMSFRICG